MGFHPDFTGTQNALIGCQMLGLSTADARRACRRSPTFAELADDIDQPLRSYSTGMQMRLGLQRRDRCAARRPHRRRGAVGRRHLLPAQEHEAHPRLPREPARRCCSSRTIRRR